MKKNNKTKRSGAHKNIIAWQMAIRLGLLVHNMLNNIPNLDFKAKSQIDKALDSTSANIVEGYYSGSTGEFIRFCRYSRRSCAEVGDRTLNLLRRNVLPNEDFLEANDLIIRTGYMIDQLIRGLEKKRDKDKESKK